MPEGVDELLRMPTPAIRDAAPRRTRGSYPVQMALGRALRKDGAARRGDPGVRARRGAGADRPAARTARTTQIAAIALEKKDQPRAIAALQRCVAVDFDNVEAARQLAGAAAPGRTSTDPAQLAPVYERIAAIDPFDAEAHAMLGRFAMQRNDADAAVARVPDGVALRPVDRAAAHTDLAESYFKGGKRAEAKKQTLAALEIAPSYERAQDLLLKIVGGGDR